MVKLHSVNMTMRVRFPSLTFIRGGMVDTLDLKLSA
jgi:hypothetical protein